MNVPKCEKILNKAWKTFDERVKLDKSRAEACYRMLLAIVTDERLSGVMRAAVMVRALRRGFGDSDNVSWSRYEGSIFNQACFCDGFPLADYETQLVSTLMGILEEGSEELEEVPSGFISRMVGKGSIHEAKIVTLVQNPRLFYLIDNQISAEAPKPSKVVQAIKVSQPSKPAQAWQPPSYAKAVAPPQAPRTLDELLEGQAAEIPQRFEITAEDKKGDSLVAETFKLVSGFTLEGSLTILNDGLAQFRKELTARLCALEQKGLADMEMVRRAVKVPKMRPAIAEYLVSQLNEDKPLKKLLGERELATLAARSLALLGEPERLSTLATYATEEERRMLKAVADLLAAISAGSSSSSSGSSD